MPLTLPRLERRFYLKLATASSTIRLDRADFDDGAAII
jgi:hypothetical protein